MTEKIPAGPELDRLVHEKFMKADGPVRPYSTDMNAAWDVWRKFPKPKRIHIRADGSHHCMVGGSDDGASAKMASIIWEEDTHQISAIICRVALRIAEVEGA